MVMFNSKNELKELVAYGELVHQCVVYKEYDMCSVLPPLPKSQYVAISKELIETFDNSLFKMDGIIKKDMISGNFCMKVHSIWFAQDDLLGAVCSNVLFGKDGRVANGYKDVDWWYEVSKYQGVDKGETNKEGNLVAISGPGDCMVQRTKNMVVHMTAIDKLREVLVELEDELKIEERDYVEEPLGIKGKVSWGEIKEMNEVTNDEGDSDITMSFNDNIITLIKERNKLMNRVRQIDGIIGSIY